MTPRPALSIRAGWASLRGMRSNNEDDGRVVVSRNGALVAVADGLGGHARGEVASRACVAALPAAMREHPKDWPGVFDRLNEAVLDSGGATTLTALSINAIDGTYAIAWAGDSPALHIGPRSVIAIEHHGYGHIVTRCLGGGRDTPHTPEVITGEARPGDVFLVASDGLDVLLDDGADARTIRRLLASVRALPDRPAGRYPASGEDAITWLCGRIAQAAIDAGSTDNVTVAITVVGAP